jgi:hypothetical protein
MADRSRGDGWWEASDGKWYPLELMDSPLQVRPTIEQVPVADLPFETSVPEGLSLAAGAAVLVSATAQAGVALAGLNLVSAMRSTPGPSFINDVPVNTAEYGLWALSLLFSLMALGVAGALVMVLLFRTSKALSARGTVGTTWSAGWTIGAWFIPIANLVIPRLVVGEMERIVQVPYADEPIGDVWKTHRRFPIGDLWWLLWVGGNLVAVFGETARIFESGDDGRFSALLAVTSIGYVMMAAAGVALFVLIRTLTRSANGRAGTLDPERSLTSG